MSSQYIIPNQLATWPWKRVLNPMLDEVKNEANAWVESHAIFEPARLKRFYACDFNLLAGLTAPLENRERLLIICDLMNFGFVVDECSEIANKANARRMAKDVIDAFRGTIHRSNDKIIAMAQEHIQRIVSVVGEGASGIERFISDYDDSLRAIAVEVEDRATGHLRTVDDYIILRRDTIGAQSVFTHFALGSDIPNAVFEHPLIVSLSKNAIDLLLITNDMHSYNVERSHGLDGHNLVTIVMREHHLDLQQALYWISGYASKTIATFLSNERALPSWGEEIDQLVRRYIDQIGYCVRGFDAWSYESHRYYGKDGLRVQECRRVTLLPLDSGYITRAEAEIEMLAA